VLEDVFILQEHIFPFTCTETCANNPVAASFILHRISTFPSTFRRRKNILRGHRIKFQNE